MDQLITHFNRKYNLTEYEITAGGKELYSIVHCIKI